MPTVISSRGLVLILVTGKEGIGTSRKRGLSPTAAERIAKMAKMAEDSTKEDFRDRARREYEERRAEGRLGAFLSVQGIF